MRSGLDFHESPYPGSPLQQLNDSRDDWVRFVLDRPMNDAPDGHWQYNSGGVIVLAGVLRAATGSAPDVFAREHLFGPIGVRGERWVRSPFDGLPHTGGGLALRALDLARVGYLVLRRGRWGDRQVVPETWLDASMRPITTRTAGWAGRTFDYGYLWRLQPLEGASSGGGTIFTGAGANGQWLFVVPAHDLVVVVTAATPDFARPVDFLHTAIIRAVRR
jgi:CubicO group peptidase (beta-lactamase class C family)